MLIECICYRGSCMECVIWKPLKVWWTCPKPTRPCINLRHFWGLCSRVIALNISSNMLLEKAYIGLYTYPILIHTTACCVAH